MLKGNPDRKMLTMKISRRMRFHLSVKNEKGVSAVEFALVLPVFLVLFFGMIEYGWVMTHQILLCHAVSEGARAAVKMPEGASDEELAAEAREAAKEAFSLVGTLEDENIYVEIRQAENYLEQPLPRRIFVEVASWAYTPLVGYLPDAAVPDTLSANVISGFP
jgi:hypothetical protein